MNYPFKIERHSVELLVTTSPGLPYSLQYFYMLTSYLSLSLAELNKSMQFLMLNSPMLRFFQLSSTFLRKRELEEMVQEKEHTT